MAHDENERSPATSPGRSNSDHTLEGTGSGRNDKEEQENEKPSDEEEKGEDGKNDEGPPKPVGFFDPRLHKTRIEVAWKWFVTTLCLMAFILAVLAMYWAVLFKVEENMFALTTIVVDFDGQSDPYTGIQPIVGPLMTQIAQQSRKPTGTLGWIVRDPADFNYDPLAVRQYIYDQHAWAAIIVNNNATALLQRAVQNGNAQYEPIGAAQVIYITARDDTTYGSYIIPKLNEYQTMVTSKFGQQWVAQVLSNTSLDPAVYSNAPQALSPAIGFSIFDLRPFTPATATPAVSIGLIYLIILSFFSFSFYIPVYSLFVTPAGHPPMHFWEMMLWRLGMTLLTYFFLSLAYSLVSLAFLIPFSNTFPHNDVTVASIPDAYGKGTFVVYWMLNCVGMTALGMASENVAMIVGNPYASLWLIFWVISNVATSFYAIPLAPGFFKWGYAWPLHNIVEASRTILFDTHSRIGLNFGILFVWAALNIAFYFPCCVFFRWKNTKEQMKKVPRSNLTWLLDG